jgi:hypothetical protein
MQIIADLPKKFSVSYVETSLSSDIESLIIENDDFSIQLHCTPEQFQKLVEKLNKELNKFNQRSPNALNKKSNYKIMNKKLEGLFRYGISEIQKEFGVSEEFAEKALTEGIHEYFKGIIDEAKWMIENERI